MKKIVLFIFIASLACILQACGAAKVDGVVVDRQLVEMMTKDNALDVLKGLMGARSNDTDSNCRVSAEGLFKTMGQVIPYNEIEFSYGFVYSDYPMPNDSPAAYFYQKADKSEICRFRVSATDHSQSRSQAAFDWQERLLTNSMVALGAKLVQ